MGNLIKFAFFTGIAFTNYALKSSSLLSLSVISVVGLSLISFKPIRINKDKMVLSLFMLLWVLLASDWLYAIIWFLFTFFLARGIERTLSDRDIETIALSFILISIISYLFAIYGYPSRFLIFETIKGENTALFMTTYTRHKGTFHEPAIFGFYSVLTFVLVQNYLKGYLARIVMILALINVFISASTMSATILLVYTFLFMPDIRKYLLILFVTAAVYFPDWINIVLALYSKVLNFFSAEVGSAEVRREAYSLISSNEFWSVFGNGLGSVSENDVKLFSVPFHFLYELGVTGFLIFIVAQWIEFRRYLSIKLALPLLQLFVISAWWLPIIYLYLSFIIYNEEKNSLSSSQQI